MLENIAIVKYRYNIYLSPRHYPLSYVNFTNHLFMLRSIRFTYIKSKLPKTERCDTLLTSKTPYVAIDERGLVRSIHLFLFSCMH